MSHAGGLDDRDDSGRLLSLDAFRGVAIAGMVLVNNPGDWSALYPPLAHARWHGWTFTDCIFPFFLFIVGVSMVLSTRRRAAAGDDGAALLLGLWRRAALIVLIGLLLNLIPRFDLATLRIPGVLQRIGLCVALAAPVVLLTRPRAWVAWIVALFVAYGVPMLLVPVPDASGAVAAGVLEPGRDFGAWVDRLLLGGHLWSASKTWDPEGLVSTLPAVATLLFGALTGHGLLTRAPAAEKTAWVFAAGLALLGLGTLLDAVLMPINKSLWTPSYAVFMAGWALLAFGLCYWLLDAAPQPAVRATARRLLLPLVIYGMNALFVFVLSGLVAKALASFTVMADDVRSVSWKAWTFEPLAALPVSAEARSLLWALGFQALMFGVAWWMWRRRWFVKI